jgi:hypothetical protein
VALVVGTVLSLVNQADVVLRGMADAGVTAKVVANFVIPFLTSSIGALLAVRTRVPVSGARIPHSRGHVGPRGG